MSTRSNLRPQPVIVDGDMSGDITSKPTVLQSLTMGSYSYSWAGTAPVGNVKVQVSNDYALNPDGSVKNAGTWVDLYFLLNGAVTTNQAPVTGNSGEGLIDWSTGAYAIRTIFVFTSGVGTLQSIFNGKVS